MSKKDTPEVNTTQKVQTKYDRKMEARKQQKIKEQREEKITRIVTAVIGIGLLAAIVISVAVSVIGKNNAVNGTYVKVGEHELSQVEYDYYYQTTVNNYLTTYASILPYFGVDTSVDFDKQEYMGSGMTWKDMFDEMTVQQIQQNKAMVDDAQKTGFTYDTTEEYASFISSIEQAASSAGLSVKQYYKETFGTYATEKNIEDFVKEGLLAGAYYNELLTQNAPSEEEIKAYYEENKQSYDRVNYRSFDFQAEVEEGASEDAASAAMDEAEKKADAMLKELQNGADFEQLCIENASEDVKADYEDTQTEKSLSEGKNYTGITSTTMAAWLFEEGRTKGELTVLRDDNAQTCYVVEFLERYFDETDNTAISNTIASQKVSDYINGLVENYQVIDVKGELKYLTIPEQDAETDLMDETSEGTVDEGADEVDNSENPDGEEGGTNTAQ